MLRHKICLVSGGTSGLGYETAKALACQGASLVVLGRDRQRCDQALQTIRKAAGHERVFTLLGDLSSQAELRQIAAQYLARFESLDILINNVGGIFTQRQVSADGYEKTWALNHLSYFLLTQELLPALKKAPAARIINLASEAHKSARWEPENLQGQQKYTAFSAYARSKLANLMFTYALARRLANSTVTVNAVHPGNVGTSIWDIGPRWTHPLTGVLRKGLRSVESGAQTSIYLATSAEIGDQNGSYFSDCQPIRSSALSYDQALQEQLWQDSLAQIAPP